MRDIKGRFVRGHTLNNGRIASEETREKMSNANWTKGKRLPQEIRTKISNSRKGSIPWNKGKTWSPEIKEKFKKAHTGMKQSRETIEKRVIKLRGEKHWSWKGGISKNVHSTSEPRYKEWRMKVFTRDGFKCRMSSGDCDKKLQAHHILRWADYAELRYQINNGITLCLAHHPRKRAEEKRLEPYFMELVSVSKQTN